MEIPVSVAGINQLMWDRVFVSFESANEATSPNTTRSCRTLVNRDVNALMGERSFNVKTRQGDDHYSRSSSLHLRRGTR
jgi:hypothetical protein